MCASTIVWLKKPGSRFASRARICVRSEQRSKVEGNADRDVTGALGEMTIQAAIRHIEDKRIVTGREACCRTHSPVPMRSPTMRGNRGSVLSSSITSPSNLIDLFDVVVCRFPVPPCTGKPSPVAPVGLSRFPSASAHASQIFVCCRRVRNGSSPERYRELHEASRES